MRIYCELLARIGVPVDGEGIHDRRVRVIWEHADEVTFGSVVPTGGWPTRSRAMRTPADSASLSENAKGMANGKQ